MINRILLVIWSNFSCIEKKSLLIHIDLQKTNSDHTLIVLSIFVVYGYNFLLITESLFLLIVDY